VDLGGRGRQLQESITGPDAGKRACDTAAEKGKEQRSTFREVVTATEIVKQGACPTDVRGERVLKEA